MAEYRVIVTRRVHTHISVSIVFHEAKACIGLRRRCIRVEIDVRRKSQHAVLVQIHGLSSSWSSPEADRKGSTVGRHVFGELLHLSGIEAALWIDGCLQGVTVSEIEPLA